MGYKIFRLNLASPLFYVPDTGADPFNHLKNGEMLFCFELDEAQYLSFEPNKEKLLNSLIFSGETVESNTTETFGEGETFLELPQGNYFFAQEKRLLNQEEIIDMAVEIQLEVLWQRFKPGRKLFLRYLFEDGNWVTQLFRPYL